MEFTTLKDFRKEYDKLREEILIRHGYKKGDKVRLNRIIVLWKQINGNWFTMTTVKYDMEWHLKLAEGKKKFKLTALV